MTTAIAVPEPVEATLVALPSDPLGTLDRYLVAMVKAREFADVVCMTPMVPKFYQGNPKAATVAVLHGAELGLNPLQALQQVFVVHGTPAIYARTMVALLKNRGFRFRTVESGPTRVVFVGTSPDGVESEPSTWTIERADKAGYIPKVDPGTGEYAVNKNGNLIGNEKYITEPENMLWAKAAAEVCRRLAPDVLLGISRTVEDIESEPEPVRVRSERVSPAEALAAASAAVESSDAAETVKNWTPPAEETAPTAPEEPADQAPAASPPMTKIQQRKVARLLGERGVSGAPSILAEIGRFLGREVTSGAEVTRDEAIRLLEHLEAEPPEAASQKVGKQDTAQVKATAEQVDALVAALVRDNVTDEAARLDWARNAARRPLDALADLTGQEAEDMTAFLTAAQAADTNEANQ
ncbi:hypothetical protein [Nocardia arizonensis]|uniref:hypothetical protein n=1 Tax=Nocardia arizonensis TaxID=1141647 RepID=UPI0006D27C2D|nr:hypothetical protein [Nocardia arizonensis]